MTARQTIRSARPRVLLFDVNDVACGWLRECLATVAETVVVRSAEELHNGLARGALAVISGRAFGGPWTTWLLGEVGTRVPVLLAASQDDLQAAEDERVFYVLSPSLPPGDERRRAQKQAEHSATPRADRSADTRARSGIELPGTYVEVEELRLRGEQPLLDVRRGRADGSARATADLIDGCEGQRDRSTAA